MAANFEETSISRNAKRLYERIVDVDTFTAGVAKFTADDTMGCAKKELSASAYKTRIEYFDAAGDDAGYVTVTAADKEAYEEMASFLKGNEATETAAGIGGSASRNTDDDAWSVKYSCEIGEDTFSVTISREYMLISGFARDETLAAIEAWADTVEEFSTPQ